MTTHLGHVIETTERYTMWLTEGIAGSKQQQGDSDGESKSTREQDSEQEKPKKEKDTTPVESDAEFEVRSFTLPFCKCEVVFHALHA